MNGMDWTAVTAWAFIVVAGPKILRRAGLMPQRRRRRSTGAQDDRNRAARPAGREDWWR